MREDRGDRGGGWERDDSVDQEIAGADFPIIVDVPGVVDVPTRNDVQGMSEVDLRAALRKLKTVPGILVTGANGKPVDSASIMSTAAGAARVVRELGKKADRHAGDLNALGCAHARREQVAEAKAAFDRAIAPATPDYLTAKKDARANLGALRRVRAILEALGRGDR